MLNCPRCAQLVTAQATTCPHCGNVLKAFGHPGIPIHRATGNEFLCRSCTYDKDDSCTFPQRPYAQECTLYHNSSQPQTEAQSSPNWFEMIRLWCQRNQALVLLIGLAIASLLITLFRK